NGGEGVHDFRHVADLEVIGLVIAQAMAFAENVGDLLDRQRDVGGGCRGKLDAVDVGEMHGLRSVGGLDVGLNGIERDVAVGIEVVERVHTCAGGAGLLSGGGGRSLAGDTVFDGRPGRDDDV